MSNFPAAGVYTIDPVHSTLTFIARHLVVSKVRGRFADFAGTITIGDSAATSSPRSSWPPASPPTTRCATTTSAPTTSWPRKPTRP